MDVHREYLKKLCRCCCSRIICDSHYASAKAVLQYAELIKDMSKIDVSLETSDIYPPYLCHKCSMKLFHMSKKAVEKYKKLELFNFKPHVENCNICSSKQRGRPKKEGKSSSTSCNQNEVQLIACKYCFQMLTSGNRYVFYHHIDAYNFIPKVISHETSGKWSLTLANTKIDIKNCEVVKHLPDILDNSSADAIFSTAHQVKVCEGNPDFPALVKRKLVDTTEFKDNSGSVIGQMQTKDLKGLADISVIRSRDCSYLIKEHRRCGSCSTLRINLQVMEGRRRKKEDSKDTVIPKNKNDRYLTLSECREKLTQLEKDKKTLSAANIRLHEKIKQVVKSDGLTIDDETNDILEETMDNHSECPFEPDTPQFLLWQQQKLQAGLKHKKAMKWHPLIIRWCLSIYLKSPSTYKHIRSSPFLLLPSKNTLLKYINFSEPGAGFNKDIIERLAATLDLANLQENQKNVSLIFDEMKIKSGLVFCPTTGKLVGFCEVGSLNDQLAEFENRFGKEAPVDSENIDSADSMEEKPLAQYVIVFMVRGIYSSLCYPFGHFMSEGFTSSQLYACAWEAVRILECIDLKVRAVVADGASPNRIFFKLHQLNEINVKDGVIHWTWNEWCPDRKIYFICDVPHLIKTTRNNLENSHGNKKTRNLMVNDMQLGWHQILDVYEWDLGLQRQVVGLKMAHKLREEHINLNPRSRMRVNLAAQVLSSTVARMLDEQNLHSTVSLRKFILLMDRFFDCLNVSRPENRTHKDALDIYTSPNDPRFEWLVETFLAFINGWEERVHNVPNTPTEEQNRMCLSKQTLEGLRITVHSFVELAKSLLTQYPGCYILSEKFSQDPLEEYFSKQRQRGGCNENPTAQEFNRNVLGLNVAGDELIRIMNGNTRGKVREAARLDVDNLNLPPIKRAKR